MSSTYLKLALRSLGLGLVALAGLLACTSLVSRLPSVDVGPFLLLLFLLYPLTAFLLGAAAHRLGLPLWPAPLLSVLVFVAIVFAFYNETALVYVPGYALASLAGYGLSYGIRRGAGRRGV